MSNRHRRNTRLVIVYSCVTLIVVFMLVLREANFEYGYMPSEDKVLRDRKETNSRNQQAYYDYWGERFSSNKEGKLNALGAVKEGAVRVDSEVLKLGREVFYTETFGNEDFFTDIMGIIDGPFTIPNILKAIAKLKGQGTTNLQVELAEDFKAGDRSLKKGDLIDTGLDVPKGAHAPLGMPVVYEDSRVKIGVTCAACHATLDPLSLKVVEGAPNSDLNVGMLMALASNSTAFFTHAGAKQYAEIKQLIAYEEARSAGRKTGEPSKAKQTVTLPDAKRLEASVDADMMKWVPGSVDSTIDMVNNPAQFPDAFTRDAHPYGWSGFTMAGPFHGLTSFSSNVHAQNTDSLTQSVNARGLFGLSEDIYLGMILQNAAHKPYRYSTGSGLKPSEFFHKADPTPGMPGVIEVIPSPTYPKANPIAPDGLLVGSKGYKVLEQMNAAAAFQNSFIAPTPPIQIEEAERKLGEEVFRKADCLSCHAGVAYTNHQVVPVEQIRTDPSRAKALKGTEKVFDYRSVVYSPKTPVPMPKYPLVLTDPSVDMKQLKLAFAHGDSAGGYKVKGLIGLFWSAPYLHNGSISVGKNEEKELGLPGTLQRGIAADPYHSLLALIDRRLRARVIESNSQSKSLRDIDTIGRGHEFWVDSISGYTEEEQRALIRYLLTLPNP